MYNYFARVLRAFAVTCLGAGGGVGLMVFIIVMIYHGGQGSFQFAFSYGLSIGLIIATLMGLIFMLLDLTSRLFLAKGLYEDIWKMDQMRQISAEGTAKDIVAANRAALLAVPYVKAVTDDIENLITRASVGQSWRSSGEQMEVEINPEGEQKWSLRCTSRPEVVDTVFDYGKNFENVQVWQQELQTALKLQSSRNGR